MRDDTVSPLGIPPREWCDDSYTGLSTLYGLWTRGLGPRSVRVGGRRYVRETPNEYAARLEAEQRAEDEARRDALARLASKKQPTKRAA